jgi:hypothetical protein
MSTAIQKQGARDEAKQDGTFG